jgi:hypothetical protein
MDTTDYNNGKTVELSDIMLQFGSTATAYEPYSETTIVYSGNELRGLLKVETDGLYCDGDIDDGSGSMEVNKGEYTFTGDENWTQYDTGFFACNFTAKNNSLGICEIYEIVVDMSYGNAPDNSMQLRGNKILIKDTSCANVSALISKITGKKFVYELATPTTAVSTAWTNPIIAKSGGTEEFTDSRSIKMFVGHDTIYGTDLTVNKAEFGATVYGGSVDFTTGEVISNKNADGTDKTAESISITPVPIMANYGANNLMSDTNGDTTVQYLDLRTNG